MNILGIRSCEHDSNISFYDGNQIRYIKSERIYHDKHRAENNMTSWKYIIKKEWGLDWRDLDAIGIVFDEWNNNLPIPKHSTIFPHSKTNILNLNSDIEVYKIEHHTAHSYGCNLVTEKKPDICIVIDGLGEDNITHSIYKNGKILDLNYYEKNGSIGIEMAKLKPKLELSGYLMDIAGKVMGLQSYGEIDYIFLKMISHFDIKNINEIFNEDNWFKYKGSKILGRLSILDWVATIHKKVEIELVRLFKKYCKKNDVIFYTGGVAHNVIWNTALKKEFPNIIIPTFCNDEGLSLGCVEYLRKHFNQPKVQLKNYPYMQHDESPDESPSPETIKKVAKLLSENKIVAWYQGNGEIGPRALGNRSILMNPLLHNGKNIINIVKKREGFRPFGASVLEEEADKYFEVEYENPYMLFVNKVKDTRLLSVTHVDGTSRIQTVNRDQNKYYYDLIKEFGKITKVPVLLNTSLNVNGKPIAGKIENAFELLYSTKVDYLVVGNKIHSK
jgi:carbamoyltransferase